MQKKQVKKQDYFGSFFMTEGWKLVWEEFRGRV